MFQAYVFKSYWNCGSQQGLALTDLQLFISSYTINHIFVLLINPSADAVHQVFQMLCNSEPREELTTLSPMLFFHILSN